MTGESSDEKEVTNAKQLRDFLDTAFDRFDTSRVASADIHAKALEDVKFSFNEDNYQWPVTILQNRQQKKRPVLVVNLCPKFIRQVTNETRQNKPAIIVHPVDDNADIETAEIIQGLIRHIEYASFAQSAYSWASDNQVRGGFGYLRVYPEYSDDTSFEQDLKIGCVRNPFTVYIDWDFVNPDASDMRYAIITEDMGRAKYKELYPDSKLASLDNYTSAGNAANWATKEKLRVAEYFYFEVKNKTIYQLEDGSVVDKKPEQIEGQPAPRVINQRETQVKQQKWCKFNAVEILEGPIDIPIKYIPIVPVFGEEGDIDGKRILKGMIRDMQDPQRQYNFMKSAEAETIALAPKAPFIAAEGQIEGYEKEWQDANIEPVSVLPYIPVSIGGVAVPPPRRDSSEPAIQAVVMAAREASEDLKGVTGIFDASLGARSNETSGKAIRARQSEGDTANYHYADNLALAINHLGRILIEWIPHIYDTQRTVRILGEDGTSKTVMLNRPDQQTGQTIYDMSAGKYDVTVTVGPSFNTKRQEAVDSMLGISQSNPQIWQQAGDLMVKSMDWPGAQQLANRLKLFLPPQVQEEESKDDQTPLPPQAQVKMGQMSQMIEQLTKALNDAHTQLETKQPENDTKIEIERMKTELGYEQIKKDLMIAMMNMEHKENLAAFNAELKMIDAKMDLLHKDIDKQDAEELQEQQMNQTGGSETSQPAANGMQS